MKKLFILTAVITVLTLNTLVMMFPTRGLSSSISS